VAHRSHCLDCGGRAQNLGHIVHVCLCLVLPHRGCFFLLLNRLCGLLGYALPLCGTTSHPRCFACLRHCLIFRSCSLCIEKSAPRSREGVFSCSMGERMFASVCAVAVVALAGPSVRRIPAKKGPERAGAVAETLRGQAQGATGAIVDPPTARGEHCAATDLVIGTASQPGGTRLVCRPWRPIEAHLCEDDVDRQSL